jgi:hypothetical protein
MPNADDLFKDEELQAKDFLEKLRPEDIGAADKDALRNILKQQWAGLQDESRDLDAKALKEWKADRGYAFERLIFKLLALEELEPSPSYYAHQKQQGNDELNTPKRRGRHPGGEQIDGSFELDGKHFLLEAKWREPMTASDMYEFRGRVDGKLVGTIGVMISASGFVEDAEYALLWGKEVNVLLVTGADVGLTLDPGNSFRAMMRAKLREAARVGRVFYSYVEFLDRRRA